jgi:hypothetical protein
MSISNPAARTLFTTARLLLRGRVYALTEAAFDPGSLWLGLELRRWNRAAVLVTVGVPFLRLDVRLTRCDLPR